MRAIFLLTSRAKFGPHMLCPVLMDKIQPPISADPAHMDVLAMVRSTTSSKSRIPVPILMLISVCHSKAMMFLYRPSLRRLIARLRSEPQSSISFGEAERKTVLKTYDACHAITQTSMYMSRTVSFTAIASIDLTESTHVSLHDVGQFGCRRSLRRCPWRH